MSNESGDRHDARPHREEKLGMMRRLRRWWFDSAWYKRWASLSDWLYEWWHPKSTSGRSYYGYYGSRRRNRLRRAWSQFRHWMTHSLPARAWRRFTDWFYDWWHPAVSKDEPAPSGQGYYGYYGRRRQGRVSLASRRVRRWWSETAVARRLHSWQNAFFAWWYPIVPDEHSYAGQGYYGPRRRGRLSLAWSKLRHRWRNSWLGRTWRNLTIAAWEWWYPEPDERAGATYYGYYGRGRRVSRPVRALKRSMRWFRGTWLGRKLRWLLDDLENLAFQVSCRIKDNFMWWRIRGWLLRWETWVLLLCLGAGASFGYAYGVPRYHAMQERQYAQQAQLWLRKGDLPRAVLRARQALSLNPSNAIATRVFGDVADFYNSPAAMFWRQRAVLFEPSTTNRLALASTAMKFEGFPFPTATKALADIPADARETPTFHLISGAMALRKKDLVAAERHYTDALKYAPNDPAARMSLAVVHLHSKDAKLIKDSRTVLELLRTDRGVGLLALRSLVAESVDHGELERAETLSKQVLTNAQSSFSDRILHLTILRMAKRNTLDQFLKETQEQAGRNPYRIGELAAWMNSSGHARDTLNWLGGLPREVTRLGLLPISMADAFAALGEWKKMAAYLLSEPWEGMEHIRFAMLALAERQGASGEPQSSAWGRAVRLASASPQALSVLVNLASAWGWMKEAEEELWFAAERFEDQPWPLQTLDQFYTARRQTAGLRRVYAARLIKDPRDRVARNNYAMVSLLMNNDVARAHNAAAELHLSDPANPVFTSTYAFSLHLLGRTKDAIEVLRSLGLDKLDDPSLALYYGVFLAAEGQAETARGYLKRAETAFMLPEETALLSQAKSRL